MSLKPAIVTINSLNREIHPGAVCFINKNHPAHALKTEWMEKRLEEGLRIKLLFVNVRSRR